MILGMGMDLVDAGRIARVEERRGERFLQRVFTAHEEEAAGSGPHRHRRLAARMAAKEAFLKALGTGLRDGRWVEMEVVNDAMGKPELHLSGRLATRAAGLGVTLIHLSLTHEVDYAAACVILTGTEGGRR
ncbi:MAG: holo-ACP synthase [Thermaerobacterales bacterium]